MRTITSAKIAPMTTDRAAGESPQRLFVSARPPADGRASEVSSRARWFGGMGDASRRMVVQGNSLLPPGEVPRPEGVPGGARQWCPSGPGYSLRARIATTPTSSRAPIGFSMWYWKPARRMLARCSGPAKP